MARPDFLTRRVTSKLGVRIRLGLMLAISSLALSACGADAPAPGIYVSELDSTAPRLIVAAQGRPVWSPDGDAIAWGNEDGLFLLDVGVVGESPRRLLADAVAGDPAWSPAGDLIAAATREGTLAVLTMPEGEPVFSLPIQIGGTPRAPVAVLAMGGPSWSPDGDMIAYVCWDGAGDEICLVGADGSDPRLLTRIDGQTRNVAEAAGGSRAAANVGPSRWSPDGKRLAAAVYGERRGAPNGVFVIDPAAGAAEKVSDLAPNSPVRWIADGAALVFSATREGRSDVYRVPLDTGKADVLTSRLAQGARNPTIDPSGARLAVESGGRILVLDPGRENAAPIVIDTPGNDAFPAWNNDGTSIAYSSAPDPIASYP